MYRAILKYNWVCENFNGKTYEDKRWELETTSIIQGEPNLPLEKPYVNLAEGWYVDEDKRICYYYSDYFVSESELENSLASHKVINYPLICFVKYDYSLLEFEVEKCNSLEYKTIRENMSCICEENRTDNCKDEKDGIQIQKLNTCIQTKNNQSAYIKINSGPTEY